MPRWLAAVLATGIVATALAWIAGPTPPRLGSATTGDPALAAAVRAAIDDPTGYRGLAVAVVEPDGTRFAGLGESRTGDLVGPHTAFEIGSIGKVFTGMLLADLAAQDTLDPDDPLAALLPEVHFGDPDVAQSTLAELASHRSGLPRIRLTGVGQALGVLTFGLRGGDPYAGEDTDWLLSTLPGASAPAGEHPVAYSNYGVAVLGQALAQHTGVTYPDLVRQRIFDPLGMRETSYHLDGANLPAGRAYGATAGGRPMAAWQGSGYAPAGIGVWSTAADLATLVAAVSTQTAPGADAATPRFDAGDGRRIGYGWFTSDLDGQQLTWHNGGTGGFRSFVGFQPATGHGVVVLGNTDRPVDALGRHLLTGDGADGRDGADWYAVAVTLVASLFGGLSLIFSTRQPKLDRLRLIANGIWAVSLPAIAYAVGAWSTLPSLVWAIGVGLSVAGMALAARRWGATPLLVARYRWLRWPGAVLSMLVGVVVLVWCYS